MAIMVSHPSRNRRKPVILPFMLQTQIGQNNCARMTFRSNKRHTGFQKIEAAFERFYQELERNGGLPYRSTVSGMWAVSEAKEVYRAFCHFRVDQYNHMADLGSGDGVAALIGSLFTRVTGYETDEVLYMKSLEIRDELKLADVRFLLQDYFLAICSAAATCSSCHRAAPI